MTTVRSEEQHFTTSALPIIKSGDIDNAIEQAKKLPNLYKSRENALVHFLFGDEKNFFIRKIYEDLNK